MGCIYRDNKSGKDFYSAKELIMEFYKNNYEVKKYYLILKY